MVEKTQTTPQWPKDMQPTGKTYAGFKDGKCVAVSMQFSGKKGLRENAQALKKFSLAGYDIQTLPHEEACALLNKYWEATKHA